MIQHVVITDSSPDVFSSEMQPTWFTPKSLREARRSKLPRLTDALTPRESIARHRAAMAGPCINPLSRPYDSGPVTNDEPRFVPDLDDRDEATAYRRFASIIERASMTDDPKELKRLRIAWREVEADGWSYDELATLVDDKRLSAERNIVDWLHRCDVSTEDVKAFVAPDADLTDEEQARRNEDRAEWIVRRVYELRAQLHAMLVRLHGTKEYGNRLMVVDWQQLPDGRWKPVHGTIASWIKGKIESRGELSGLASCTRTIESRMRKTEGNAERHWTLGKS